MKATAITVTHRKEKDVDIYTATRGPYELEIANVGHLKIITATETNQDGTAEDMQHTSEIFAPFFTAIQKFKNDQNANDLSTK
jgi:hypothetical protein